MEQVQIPVPWVMVMAMDGVVRGLGVDCGQGPTQRLGPPNGHAMGMGHGTGGATAMLCVPCLLPDFLDKHG